MSDSFFVDPSKRKRKNKEHRNTSTIRSNQKKQKIQNKKVRTEETVSNDDDSDAEDIDEEEVDSDVFADLDNAEDEIEDINESDEEEEFKNESEADKRRRLAKKYLEDLKTSLGVENDEGENNYEFDAKDLDNEIISSRLKKDVAEQKGWVYKYYSKEIEDINKRKLTRVPNKCLTSVCVSYPYLFTTSKDMEISKWDIRDPTKNPKIIKTVKGGSEFEELSKEHSENGHCKEIFTSAVSPDGKYLVTGGKDGRTIVWSVNSLSCIRVLETKNRKGEVLSLVFRRNSDQLYVACADLKIRIYSINQLAQLETLYGHQDLVIDISALGLERCVTVGSRDRTAMLWKIADETRLTFRGGDSIEKFGNKKNKKENNDSKNNDSNKEEHEKIFFEGSIDCVSMIDDSHFVTGSDNGNISLWSLNKKKPLFTKRISHGIQPKSKYSNASAELDEKIAEEQISEPQPFWITNIYAIPYSDIFISGSWDGNLKVWKLDETLRSFELLQDIKVNGIVSKITCYEDEENNQLRIYTTLSKEHKFSRCIKPLPGSRNVLFTCIFNLKK